MRGRSVRERSERAALPSAPGSPSRWWSTGHAEISSRTERPVVIFWLPTRCIGPRNDRLLRAGVVEPEPDLVGEPVRIAHLQLVREVELRMLVALLVVEAADE